MDLTSALLGATIALLVREYIEWRLRVKHKRENCSHRFDIITEFGGHQKQHCSKCGIQEFIRDEDDV